MPNVRWLQSSICCLFCFKLIILVFRTLRTMRYMFLTFCKIAVIIHVMHLGCQAHMQKLYLCPALSKCHWILHNKRQERRLSAGCVGEEHSVCVSSLGYWEDQFVIESLHGSIRQTGEDLPVWFTTTKWIFNVPLGAPRVFPAITDISLFIWWGKKTRVGEGRELTEVENGSIMSVGRLDLWHFVSAEERLSEITDVQHQHNRTQIKPWNNIKYQTSQRKSKLKQYAP